MVLTLTYLWLPYMVLPVYAGIDSMRGSLLEASADLGARPWTAFRTVVLPMLGPAVAAGSVFTFSLSLGDYITVQLVGGTNQMLGNLVYTNFSTDLPFAAAVALLPLLVMAAYLLTIRRTGALEHRLGERSPCADQPACPLAPLGAAAAAGAGVHLRAAAAGAGQLLLHQRHLRLATAGVHAALVAGRGVDRGPRAALFTSVQVGARRDRDRRWSSARSPRWRWPGTTSSAATGVAAGAPPIALPGIVTGIALNTLFTQALGGLTFFTLVAGHATFCIVSW